MSKHSGCPRCGSNSFYTKLHGRQFYDKNGSPGGYEIDGETKTVWCYYCGYKMPLKRLEADRKRIGIDKKCLFCKNSLSADDENGSPVLVCFECSGHEGTKVQVAEESICKNFKEE